MLLSNPSEISAGFESEDRFQIKLPYQLISGVQAELALDFSKQESNGITVITTAETDLLADDVACFVEGHARIDNLCDVCKQVLVVVKMLPDTGAESSTGHYTNIFASATR